MLLNKLGIPVWPRVSGQAQTTAASTWKPMRIGAGGYLTAMEIAPDGTMVTRTDTYGAYRWDGQWAQLVTAASMPAEDVHVDFDQGVFEIAIAPSNTSRFGMLYEGYFYLSNDKGAHWSKKANFARLDDAEPNGSLKLDSTRIAFDPANADVIYVGTPSDGLRVSLDGGATWAVVTGMETSGARGFLIAFDPSSAVTGGRTQGIFISRDGTGVYYSDDAGATWALTTGGPTTHKQMRCGGNGRLYLTTGTPERLWVYTGGLAGTWAERTISGDGNTMAGVAVDPADPDRVVVVNDAGLYHVSTDGVATNGELTRPRTCASGDIPWLAWAQNVQPLPSAPFMSIGSAAFDPTVPGRCYFSAGIGVWYSVPDEDDTEIAYFSQSAGIEQLVANTVTVPPDGKPIVCSWDRPCFRVDHPDVFPSTYLPDNSVAILMGWDCDYAFATPTFLAVIINWFGYNKSGYSTDGGETLIPFASYPYDLNLGKIGGCICVLSPTQIIWSASNNARPYYTADGGVTWQLCSFPAVVPTFGETGWSWAYFLNRHVFTPDRVTADTAYAYNYFSTAAGIYKTTDGGATWTQIYSGNIVVGGGFNAKLTAVPYNAGHLFLTAGQQGVSGDANPAAGTFFYRSTDGGVTWNVVPDLLEVCVFGFGAPKPGGSGYPSIAVVAWYKGGYGIWVSTDDCATFELIEDWPLNSIDKISCLSGDLGIYGRWYVGFGGSGFSYGDRSDATVPPIIIDITVEDTPDGGIIRFRTDKTATSRIDYGLTTAYGAFIDGAATTTHEVAITGQASSTVLHYKITCTDALARSSFTSDRTFMTTDITPPSQVTGLVATAVASSKITLSAWAATDDIGVVAYKVRRAGVLVATIAAPPYTDRNLLPNTLYSYTVSALDAAGNEGAQSTAATATTQNGAAYIQTDAPDPVHLPGFETDSHTFTGVIVQPGRNIIGVINQNGGFNGGISSVTVNPGGLVAVKKVTDQVGEDRASQWLVDIPSGTLVDITIQTPESFSVVGITVGVLLNVPLTTPHDTGFHDYHFADAPKLLPFSPAPPATQTDTAINVPINGVAVELFYVGVGTLQTPIWDDNSVANSYKRVTGVEFGLAVLSGRSYEAGDQQFSLDAANGAFDYSECSAVVTTWAA